MRTIPVRSLVARFWISIASLAVLAGCGGGGGASSSAPPSSQTPVLTTLTASISVGTIRVGQVSLATVIGLDQRGAIMDLGTPVWSVETPSVATVSTAGVVTGVSPGQTYVSTTASGRVARVAVTVLDVAVSRVVLSEDSLSLARGTSRQLSAAVLDEGGQTLQGRTIGWSSADPTRATVSPSGVVTAVATGVTTVSATNGGAKATATIRVAGAPGEVAWVTISPDTGVLVVGDTLHLAVLLQDSDGYVLTGREVTWSSTVASGNGVATVSASGVVTALSAGTILVEASSEGQRGAVAIIVRDNVDPGIVVTIADPVKNSTVGDSLKIYASVTSANPLVSIVATLGDKTLLLKEVRVGFFGAQVAWVGVMDIADLHFGPYLLTVTATDNRAAIGIGAVAFNRDTRTGTTGIKVPPKSK